MNRNQAPVALLASVLIHVMALFAAARWLGGSRPVPHQEPEVPTTPIARVVFPPPEAFRPPAPPSSQARPPEPPSPPQRAQPPEPTPPPAREPRDRVSIGGPAPQRQKTPLELRRDEEVSRRVAQGRPDAPGTPASPTPGAESPQPSPSSPADPAPSPQVASVEPGEAAPTAAGPPQPSRPSSIADSLRDLGDRLAEGQIGIESGAGQQMGPLFFDPQGADFTAWVNSFRIEVYRNWIVPQSVRFGARGYVNIEFRIDRDGKLTGLRVVRPSGTPALDRAASNALLGGRFPALPADYRPAQMVVSVSFFYNEGAR